MVRHLLRPPSLLIGNLFQQLYNTVDTWVVETVSNEAFSAVGNSHAHHQHADRLLSGRPAARASSSPSTMGPRYDKVHDTVHTAIVMTLFGVLFTGVGIAIIPPHAPFMKTPPRYFRSAAYLTIYFCR